MLIFKKVSDLQHWLQCQNMPVGFVPTMGALHEGHLELVRMAKSDGCVVVSSIFVNPTQFNNPKDLEKYPRTPEKDAALLLTAQCDALFLPSVDEVYPTGQEVSVNFDFKQLDKVMEGEFRPGHFKGMATVVHRLLDIVRPHQLYMGQKDYQQLCIVRDMIRQHNIPTQLVMCPTIRETDGLAMSSRNVRLTPEMRTAAPVIYSALKWAETALKNGESAFDITITAIQKLTDAGLQPEYFEVVDGVTLLPVENWNTSNFIVACTAAFAGDVRLIDNVVLRSS
jgi:pantoate--beta-alanine ligase